MDHSPKLPNQLPMQEILSLASSPAGQQLIALLRQQGGSEFQHAIERAAAGDYTQAKRAIESIMSDPKAQELLKNLRR